MTKPIIDVVDTFFVNTIVWLRSLPENELGPSRRMAEDIETLARARGVFEFVEMNVCSAVELRAALSSLADRCRKGLRPILHFDCHGSEDYGLWLAPSGDFLGWQELAAWLREINVAAENNVCCIFGVCFGLHLSTALSITKPTPYFLTIAPEGEIAVGELETRFPSFYEYLLTKGSITEAYNAVLEPAFGIFKCQAIFGKAVATYIVNHASGAALATRRESLLTRTLTLLGIKSPTPEELRHVRGQVKDGLKFDQASLDQFAGIFLIGRAAAVNLDQVQAIANELRKA
jgi:hypothetical protein